MIEIPQSYYKGSHEQTSSSIDIPKGIPARNYPILPL